MGTEKPENVSLRRFFASQNVDETLTVGAKLYVKYSIIAGVIGLVVLLVFLFAFFLPNFDRINDDINEFDEQGPSISEITELIDQAPADGGKNRPRGGGKHGAGGGGKNG